MNYSNYNISLDLHHGISPHALPIKQGDTARMLNITLVEDGAPYEIAEGCTAILCVKLPDGTETATNMTLADNVASVLIPADWTAAVGEIVCEVEITDGVTMESLRSPLFSVVITESLTSTMYRVYYDRYPNAPRVLGSRSILTNTANFDVYIETPFRGEATGWLLIPEIIAPEGGLEILAEGVTFTDQGVSEVDTPYGVRSMRTFSTTAPVPNIQVAVRVKREEDE